MEYRKAYIIEGTDGELKNGVIEADSLEEAAGILKGKIIERDLNLCNNNVIIQFKKELFKEPSWHNETSEPIGNYERGVLLYRCGNIEFLTYEEGDEELTYLLIEVPLMTRDEITKLKK